MSYISLCGTGGLFAFPCYLKSILFYLARTGNRQYSFLTCGINIANVDSACQKTVLSVAGAGEISASFTDCDELKCSIAGAGEIELNGKVANYSESIAGSGRIKKDKLLITGESR